MSNLINFQKESVVRKQSYTEQQKESAINRYKNGESVIAIAKDFNTSRSTIHYWIKQAERHAIHVTINSVSVEDYKKIQKKLRRQQLMVEILQIANCSPPLLLQKS